MRAELEQLRRALEWVLDQVSWRDHYYWNWDSAPAILKQPSCAADSPELDLSRLKWPAEVERDERQRLIRQRDALTSLAYL